MMNCLRIFHCGVNPCFDDFKNKEAIAVHQPGIDHAAFKVCKALLNEWSANLRGRLWREVKLLEFVHLRTMHIASTHNLFSEFHGWNVDDTLLGCF